MITAELLELAGFTAATYPDSEGVFYIKRLPIHTMPSVARDLVDGDNIQSADELCIEVCPNNTIQLLVLSVDHAETDIPLDSDEGREILREAGVALEGAI